MSQTIKYVSIKNYKWIKDVEVGDLKRFVAIFWENWAWKTSFIEAIKSAIKLEKWGNSKVRIWEEKGEIIVEFDDFTIKRIIGEKGDLKVEHNGELVSRPQSWLDNIFLWSIGDPNKFLNLHDKEKIKYLLETQGKKIEYDALESQRSPLFEQRKDIHRTYLAKKEEVDQTDTTEFETDIEDNWEKLSQLHEKLQKAEIHNKSFYDMEARLERWNRLIIDLESDIRQSEWTIEELEKRLKEEREKLSQKKIDHSKATDLKISIQKEIDVFDQEDTKSIITEIEELNKKDQWLSDIKARKRLYNSQCEQRDTLQWKWKDLDNSVKEIEQQQNDLIRSLDIWYELKLEDGVMSLKVEDTWIPLDELNKALQIELAVDICLKWPNKIKVITIEDANTLDPQTLERIREKIEKFGAQCFLETVYNTGYEEITIKDWEILSTNK